MFLYILQLLYIIPISFCSTDVITTFYSFNISSTAISEYSNIILIMSALTFFNKNIAYILLVSVFIAHVLNLIMKLAICFLLYLNVLIFHLASATLFLSLNTVLISLISSFQSWESFSSIWLIFFYTYILVILPLSQASATVILSLVAITLFFLRNN